jgi:hypothetical protein
VDKHLIFALRLCILMVMDFDKDKELITMGVDLGVYTIARFFSEGAKPNKKAFEILATHCANNLQKNRHACRRFSAALSASP